MRLPPDHRVRLHEFVSSSLDSRDSRDRPATQPCRETQLRERRGPHPGQRTRRGRQTPPHISRRVHRQEWVWQQAGNRGQRCHVYRYIDVPAAKPLHKPRCGPAQCNSRLRRVQAWKMTPSKGWADTKWWLFRKLVQSNRHARRMREGVVPAIRARGAASKTLPRTRSFPKGIGRSCGAREMREHPRPGCWKH